MIDGKLEESFWTGYRLGGTLKNVRPGKGTTYPTEFRARWWKDSLNFGIWCEGQPGQPPLIGTRQSGDPAIWDSEHIELLIEFSPLGPRRQDLPRPNGIRRTVRSVTAADALPAGRSR